MGPSYFVDHRWMIHGPALVSACLSILGSLFVIVCACVSGRAGEPTVHAVLGLSIAQLSFSVCVVIGVSTASLAYDVCGYFGFVDLAAQTAVRMWVCVIAVDVAVSVIRRASKTRRTRRQREHALSGNAVAEERATTRSMCCSYAGLVSRHAIVLAVTALVVFTLFAMSWLASGGPLLGALESQHSPCFDAAKMPLPNACNRTQWVPKTWCAPILLAFGQFSQRVLDSPGPHEGQVCVDTLSPSRRATHTAVDRFVAYDKSAGEIHAGCWLTSGFDRIAFVSLPALLCCLVALGAWAAASCTLSSTARRVRHRLVNGRCLCAKRWPGARRASATSRIQLGERTTTDSLRTSGDSISINAQLLGVGPDARRLLGEPKSVGKLAGRVRARYNRFTARYILVSIASLVPMLVRDVWTTVPEQFGGGSAPHAMRRSAVDPDVHFYICGRDTHGDISLVLLFLDSVCRPLGGAIVALVFALSGDLTPWTLECGESSPEAPSLAPVEPEFDWRSRDADRPPRRRRWRCCCRIVRRGGAAKLWLAESRGHYTVAFRRSVHSLVEGNTPASAALTTDGASSNALSMAAQSAEQAREAAALAAAPAARGGVPKVTPCKGGEMMAEQTTRKLTAKEWRLRQEAIVSKRSEQVMQRMPRALMAVLPRLTERLAWKICASLFRVLSSGEMQRILAALDAAQRDAWCEAEARCSVFAHEQEREQRDEEDGVRRTLASSSTLNAAFLFHGRAPPDSVLPGICGTSTTASHSADVERVAFMLLRTTEVAACLWDAVVEACEVIGLDVAQFYDVERSVALE